MAKGKFQNKWIDPETAWTDWFSTSAFSLDKRLRRTFRILPRDPRCRFCDSPFQGLGGTVVRTLFGKERSVLNPRFCNMCDQASRVFPGGAEVDWGVAFFGAMGTADGLTDITVIGEEVNTAARIASKAAAGEIIISEQALKHAGVDSRERESRSLELKGISQPVLVRVMRGSQPDHRSKSLSE